MTDREFLIWLHKRLEHVYGESPAIPHMHKIRAMIKSIDREKVTLTCGTGNKLEHVLNEIDL